MGLITNIFKKKEELPPFDVSSLNVDVHSHFIPGIDDGAQTIEDSLRLISEFFKEMISCGGIRSGCGVHVTKCRSGSR